MTTRTGTEFFDQLTSDEAAALARVGRRREYRRAAVIMREGDRSDWMVVLQQGRVKVSSDTANGTEVVLAVRGPGALLGELSAIGPEPRSATVTALETVKAMIISRTDFEAFLQAHGRVAVLLLQTVVNKLRDADRKRIEFGAHDTTGRVAARLVEMAERFGQPADDGVKIALPFSQDELAGWIGASREAVSKALGVLRSAGWIRTSRMSVVVRDVAALRRRAE
jgi:CRP/FNR family transcriptional regulator, cyclic AMP receptor protein